MYKQLFVGVAALTAAFSLALGTPTQASSLSHIGKAIAYPVKKAAGNTGKSATHAGKAIAYPIKKGAGNGSKGFNHVGKTVEYPVRKAGVNTSKTAHKVTGQP